MASSKLSKREQKLYDKYNEVIGSESITEVQLVERSKRINFGSFGQAIDGDKIYPINEIDMSDLDNAGTANFSKSLLMLHEIWESYLAQNLKKKEYDDASSHTEAYKVMHKEAKKMQGEILGFSLGKEGTKDGSFDTKTKSFSGTILMNYLDDKGKKMHLQYVFKDGTLVSMAEQNGYFKK
jgi:hypothetical protein